jgi:hypothetical protein
MNISVLKDLPASLSMTLLAAQINFVEDLVSGSLDDLAKRTGLDSKTCERLVRSACLHLAPPCVPLKELDETQTFLKTGIEKLDDALDGGLLTGTVTEVYGESSGMRRLLLANVSRSSLKLNAQWECTVGKTNFCLQVSLMAQLPLIHGGLDSGMRPIAISYYVIHINMIQTSLFSQRTTGSITKDSKQWPVISFQTL